MAAVSKRIVVFPPCLAGEMLKQQRNILHPVGQCRHFNAHDIEPVKQIGTKAAAFDGGKQRDAGRRDQAHIDGDRQHAAHPFDNARFQDAQ